MKDAFLDKACGFRWLIAIFFATNVLFFLITAFTLPATDPSSQERLISWLTLAISGTSLAILAPLMYACRHHGREPAGA